MTDEGKGGQGVCTRDNRSREGYRGYVQEMRGDDSESKQGVTGMMRISKGTGNSKVSCADAIRGGKLNLTYYVNKQEAYGPHRSPENQFLTINNLQQNFDSVTKRYRGKMQLETK